MVAEMVPTGAGSIVTGRCHARKSERVEFRGDTFKLEGVWDKIDGTISAAYCMCTV